MAQLPPLLGIQRATVAETTVNTLIEGQINTPVSATARMIMRIWRIVMTIQPGALPVFPAADALVNVAVTAVLSTRGGEATIPDLGRGGTIATTQFLFLVGSAPADAGVVANQQFNYPMWDFPGGLGIADSVLSLYLLGANMVGVSSVFLAIYYTMEVVSTDDFLAIASILSDIR